MTLRDKIMDKYWLEFLVNQFSDGLSHNQEYKDTENRLKHKFWLWFYGEVMKGRAVSTKLEDYLK